MPVGAQDPDTCGPVTRWRAALTSAERADRPSGRSDQRSVCDEATSAKTARAPADEPFRADASADARAPERAVGSEPGPAWAWTTGFESVRHGDDLARSFVESAVSRLAKLLALGSPEQPLPKAARIAEGLSEALVEEIEVLIFRTVTLERRIAALDDRADSVAGRFDPGFRRPEARRQLFETYPGLLRQLHLRCDRWVAACLEMDSRLRSDRSAISDLFGISIGDGVAGATMASGDAHHGGRRVVILRFASGRRLVYKPRPVAAAERFQALLALLNRHGLDPAVRTIAVLPCGDYGWMEHVAGRSCRSDAAVSRYFRRAGALIAALHAVGATDCHFENVIADGEHPVVVDLETLMRPRFRPMPDTAAALAEAMIDESVLAIGMLPSIDGSDLGALAVEPNQSTRLTTMALVGAGTPDVHVERIPWRLGDVASLPLRMGERIGAAGLALEIERGFVEAYGLIEAARDALLAPDGIVAELGRSHVRVVLRPTAHYSELLSELSHPVALHDAAAADGVTSRLRLPTDGLRDAAACDEVEQLMRADVPCFGLRGDEEVLRFGGRDGSRSSPLTLSGLDSARDRLSSFGWSDLSRQRALIVSALNASPERKSDGGSPADPLHAACEIGDALVVGAVRLGDAAAWVHVVEQAGGVPRQIVQTGPWLYDGLLGIALFLAQLAEATGDGRYAATAAAAAQEARRQIRCDARPGAGVFEGLGGLVYVFSHLALLLDDETLLQDAERAAYAVVPSIEGRLISGDLVAGSAGLALAGLSLDAVRSSETSRRLLKACEVDLVDMANGVFDARLPFARGASHGWSGVLLALARLQAARPASDLEEAVGRAAALDAGLTSGGRWTDPGDADHEGQVSWCHGPPGIALCRMSAADAWHVDGLDEAVRAAVLAMRDGQRAKLPGLGLCHGSPGVWEAMLAASRTGLLPIMEPPLGDCGYPSPFGATSAVDVLKPGLMTGLAGLGHMWLTLHDAKTAGILTLDAPRVLARCDFASWTSPRQRVC